MRHSHPAIAESEVPQAANPVFQHLLDTYASETNKVIAVWECFEPADLAFRPDPKSSTVADILKHQLLSERRFFGEFIGTHEPPAAEVLPASLDLDACITRMAELARPRLNFFAGQTAKWWMEDVPFFGVSRQRIWVFWRRVLHTCHHRAQLTMYLRMLKKPVPSVYGPTSDETWDGADPTTSVAAAGRK
ncbi:MAG TPA: DinB family protein [Terriglobales bacterium]|nr:DinB family protein [Terriglobales bacterium]